MMTGSMLAELVRAIAATGVEGSRAERLAALIGDTPELSEDAREVIVRDDLGTELARLPASVLGEAG